MLKDEVARLPNIAFRLRKGFTDFSESERELIAQLLLEAAERAKKIGCPKCGSSSWRRRRGVHFDRENLCPECGHIGRNSH